MVATQSAATHTRHLEPSWQWPIDLTHYDRTPTLTATEDAALTVLGWEIRRGRCHDPHRSEWTAIKRLLRPLDDARRSLYVPDDRYHYRSSLDAVALILHGCATTQQAFWAWSPENWIDQVFTKSQIDFRHAYPGWIDASVRPYAVAIAYLLDCFTAFQLLGGFNRTALANRLFGPVLVQQALDPVTTTLREWGYRTGDFAGMMSALLLHNRSPYLADLTAPVIGVLSTSPEKVHFRNEVWVEDPVEQRVSYHFRSYSSNT